MPRPITIIACAFVLLCSNALLGAKHDSWVEVRSPNFIVVSNAGEKQARNTAVHFEQIRSVFRNSLVFASLFPSPKVTILAVKDENSMKALLPEYWAKGHGHPAGMFIGNMGQFFAAVDLSSEGTNPFLPMYHEYYHSLTNPYVPNFPTWLSEGLADFYGNTDMKGSEASLGVSNPDLIAEFQHGNLIPLQTLFQVDHNSPYYNEQNKMSIFYAESWAVVHYLIVGDKGAHAPLLTAYLQALSTGASWPEAAKAFGDLKKFQEAVYRYILDGRFYYLKAPPPPSVPPSDLQTRELSDAEAEVYRGGFEAVRGKTADAKQMLEEALKLDPKLSLGYVYLGFAEVQDKQHAEALADFTRAIDLNPKNSLALYFRAYLASKQEGRIGNDEQLEKDLRAAIAISPEFAPPYAMLAYYLYVRRESLPEALELAKKAVNMEPANSNYLVAMAQVLSRMDRYDDAHTIAVRARDNARDLGQKMHAEQFLTFLENEKGQSNVYSHKTAVQDSGDRPNPALKDSEAPSDSSSGANLQEASGLVTNTSCMDGLKFEVATDSGPLTLHSKPDVQLMFLFKSASTGQFNPCTQLKGQHVTVKYRPDDKGNSGVPHNVTILSGTTDEPAVRTSAQGARHLQAPAKADDPSTVSVEGDVTEVTCTGNEMTLILDAGGTPFTLHARDATRVPYEQDVAFDAGNFQACSQLKNRHAKITFTVVVHKKYSGEIQDVEIIK
jgi:tetratricopeptide (TPR) repeat protein